MRRCVPALLVVAACQTTVHTDSSDAGDPGRAGDGLAAADVVSGADVSPSGDPGPAGDPLQAGDAAAPGDDRASDETFGGDAAVATDGAPATDASPSADDAALGDAAVAGDSPGDDAWGGDLAGSDALGGDAAVGDAAVGDAAPPEPYPSIGGCRIFPADNPWNQRVDGLAVHPRSDVYLANMQPASFIRLDMGTIEEEYGIPITVVPASQPLVPLTYGVDGADFFDESDLGPYPIPLDVHIEGGTTADPDPQSGDRHVIVVQQDACMLYETLFTMRSAGGFRVACSATWDLKSNATRPPGWTSADAAGLPILPGLMRYDEIAAGAILHALRFTVNLASRAYVAPASHFGTQANNDLPPYGLRVRLKATFDISPYGPDTQVLLTALKTYGMIFADQGSSWYITGTSDPRALALMQQVNQGSQRIPATAFEVVDTGAAKVCGFTPCF